MKKKYFDRTHWLEELEIIRQKEPLPRNEYSGEIAPWQVIETLREITGGKSVLTTEVGQHQMWAAMHYRV